MTRYHAPAAWLPTLTAIVLAVSLAGCGDRDRTGAGNADTGGTPASGTPPPAAGAVESASALDHGPRAAQALALSDSLAAVGQVLFDTKGCTGCHELGSADSAPDLRGVGERRTEAWLRRQLTAPEWMAEHDPVTRAMVEQYGVPMSDLDVTDDEATALLHYMLSVEAPR
jgi:cytochrome c551/c552